jgi:2-succinyl-6-hydroxy-2,4-cyclohexadiene-1-carboxylate synthase
MELLREGMGEPAEREEAPVSGRRPRLRVLRRGEAQGGRTPALLLHGFTGCAEAWGEGILAGLGRGLRVLAVDLPGHGESGRSTDPARYEWGRVLQDLVDVLDSEKIRRADWVGYSMGGRLALAAAVLHPDRVRRLVLESTTPGLAAPEDRARRRRQDEALARRLEAGGIEGFVDFWMHLPLFASQERLPATVLRDARRRRLRNHPGALAAVLRGLGTGVQPSFWDRLGEVQAETLLLTGALDEKYEGVARRMMAALHRARHVTVPTAGHTVHLESPRGWLEAVRPFLAAPSSSVTPGPSGSPAPPATPGFPAPPAP